MSLINDALRRAGEAQKGNPPPQSNLEFLAADPTKEQPRRQGQPLLVVALIVVFVLGGALIFFALKSPRAPVPEVVKASPAAVIATPASPVEKTVTAAQPSPIAPKKSSPDTSPTVLAAATETQLVTTSVAPTPETVAVYTTATNTVALPEPPKPASPKLQGIAYNPRRPSAVVSGKTVFVGSKVGEFRVLGITVDSVTIGNASQTNVLTMAE